MDMRHVDGREQEGAAIAFVACGVHAVVWSWARAIRET